MRLRLISAFAALATLSPVMAHATASQAAGFTWTGMFIGINGGYGKGSSDWDLSPAGSNNRDLDGGIIGLQAGYNAQLANGLVAGIALSTHATNIDGKSSCGANRCESGVGSLSDISGRLGVNYRGSLLFAKGGIAYQNIERSIHSAGVNLNDKDGSLGYIVGGGVEFYIDNNITTNIEYNYYDFDPDTTSVGGVRIDDSNSISIVKAGLNLKFN